MAIHTFGPNAVDWEERVDLGRLRDERLARLRAQLERSELGALLSFDFANIRYMTSTHIGTWAMDKLIRFALLPRGGEPVVWDFGSAARHHQLYNPWLDHTPGPATPEGAGRPGPGPASPRCAARSTRTPASPPTWPGRSPPSCASTAWPTRRSASTWPRCRCSPRCRAEGIETVDGQQVFLEARRTKTRDEISLLAQACSMVDAAYTELYEFLRPGVRENECVGLVSKVLYGLGSEYVEGVNAISGERCSPHPHVYSDRLIRPGDPAFFDILHSHLGYRTCYYRTFAVGSASRAQRDAYVRCREYMDQAIALVKPGATTADIVSLWPRADGVRVPGRDRGVRAAVRPRRGPVDLGEADLQPAGVAGPPGAAGGGNGVRAGDLLAGRGWLVRRADRGGGRGHGHGMRGHHEVPGRGTAGRRAQVLDRGRRARHPPGEPVAPEHGGRTRRDGRGRRRRGETGGPAGRGGTGGPAGRGEPAVRRAMGRRAAARRAGARRRAEARGDRGGRHRRRASRSAPRSCSGCTSRWR